MHFNQFCSRSYRLALLVPCLLAFSTAISLPAALAEDESKEPAKPADQKAAADKAAAAKKIGPSLAPLLGKAYKQMSDGKFDPAVKTLNKAIATDKESITARRYMAFALVKNGDPKDAIKELNVIVRQENRKPTYFEWCTFGEAYLEGGALDQAESCYKQALRIAPTSEYAKSGLIRVSMKAGNYEEARQTAADAMKITKDKDHYNYYKNLYMAAADAAQRGGSSITSTSTAKTPTSTASTETASAQPAKQWSGKQSEANEAILRNIQNSTRRETHPGG